MDEPQNQTNTSLVPGDAVPPLLLSKDEQRILALYDELRDLEVKVALVKAQQSYSADASAAKDTEGSVKTAQQDAAKARAGWLLRNDIMDSVMMADPILKAVHSSTKATPIETDILPHVSSRDATSIALAKTSADIRATLDELTKVEAESLRVGRQNVELAAEILRLTAEADRHKEGETDDPAVQAEIARLQADLKESRQKWKSMKGTASAVVAGSGVDWSRDDELRDMVLDPEED